MCLDLDKPISCGYELFLINFQTNLGPDNAQCIYDHFSMKYFTQSSENTKKLANLSSCLGGDYL